MTDDRLHKTTFSSAPPSVTSLVAAFLGPALTVLVFVVTTLAFGERVLRSDLMLCVLAFSLTFPGRSRFKDRPLVAGLQIVGSWACTLAILWLCGYATDSLRFFNKEVLLVWSLAVPLLQWLAVATGRAALGRREAQASRRSLAIVVGAGPLGVKVARALRDDCDKTRHFVGWFDDRSDDRVHADAAASMLGTLDDVAPYILAHGVKEVYIALPMGSHPRMIELQKSLQGTTATILFAPDVFGISIIPGSLQDMNGVPVVSIRESPFIGTNLFMQRVPGVLLASIILVMIAPLLLAISLGVKSGSPGSLLSRRRPER